MNTNTSHKPSLRVVLINWAGVWFVYFFVCNCFQLFITMEFWYALFFGQSTGIVCMRPMHLAAVNCGVIGWRKLLRWYQRYRWPKVNIAILSVLINITSHKLALILYVAPGIATMLECRRKMCGLWGLCSKYWFQTPMTTDYDSNMIYWY